MAEHTDLLVLLCYFKNNLWNNLLGASCSGYFNFYAVSTWQVSFPSVTRAVQH